VIPAKSHPLLNVNGIPPAPVLEINQKLGKYEVRSVAGSGNMGTVYRAYDPYSNRDVALKVCSTGDVGSETEQRMFRRLFFNEAHTAGALAHPNILAIYDAVEDRNVPYIVMEYLENSRTLETYIRPDSLLPLDDVINIVFRCAKALDYAHRRGVVHRDIKPSNILLTEEGEVKIGDFGIAQQSQADTTQVLGVVGSPKYMSPEQAREEDLTGQSDLYSLGVVLFELLTGRSPYPSETLTGLLQAIVNDTPPSATQLRPSLPPSISAITARALAKDRLARYATGAEFAADLAVLVEGLDDTRDEVSDDEKFRELRACTFFNDFSDAEVWEVLRACVWQRHPLRTRLITEGSFDSAFFVLISGAVAVTRGGVQITTLTAGDCFGEMGYLSRTLRSASIIAQEDVVLLKISDSLMQRASLGCQLRFNKHFLGTLVERLTRTSSALSKLKL
jgi:serine/threonine protein kinase